MSIIKPYMPDLKKIAQHSEDMEPMVLSPEEYDEILSSTGLRRGTRLSDVGILKALEAGLIKIWDEEGNLDLLKNMQSASLDLTLGHEFWHYKQHRISRLTMGQHKSPIADLSLLEYNYKNSDDVFVFHSNCLVLAQVQEVVSLSNVVIATFDGKSTAGRLGLSNHQTAGLVHAGYCGKIMMEISNTNNLDIAVPIGVPIGTLNFHLLDQPSTRPENLKTDSQSKAYKQASPFGFRDPEWDKAKKEMMKVKVKPNGLATRYDLVGDPMVVASKISSPVIKK